MTRHIGTVLIFACMLSASNVVLLAEGVQLFDGKTLRGWTTLDGQPITAGWEVVDGMIRLDPRRGRPGHIISTREFGDFDLSFEWKIAKGGNSGLKYRVRRLAEEWYGCEYQILDDNGYRKRFSARQSAGALYDLYEPNREKQLAPAGQFNSSRLIVKGNKIQHWLNGRLIVSATVGDRDWRCRLAESKFADLKGFGENSHGRLMLTDHGSEVWFRNFRFNPLPMRDEQHADVGASPLCLTGRWPALCWRRQPMQACDGRRDRRL